MHRMAMEISDQAERLSQQDISKAISPFPMFGLNKEALTVVMNKLAIPTIAKIKDFSFVQCTNLLCGFVKSQIRTENVTSAMSLLAERLSKKKIEMSHLNLVDLINHLSVSDKSFKTLDNYVNFILSQFENSDVKPSEIVSAINICVQTRNLGITCTTMFSLLAQKTIIGLQNFDNDSIFAVIHAFSGCIEKTEIIKVAMRAIAKGIVSGKWKFDAIPYINIREAFVKFGVTSHDINLIIKDNV